MKINHYGVKWCAARVAAAAVVTFCAVIGAAYIAFGGVFGG